MPTVPSPSRSPLRSTKEALSPSWSPTLLPRRRFRTILRCTSNTTQPLFPRGMAALPPRPQRSPACHPLPPNRLPPRGPQKNFSQVSPTPSTTPRTSASSRPDSSIPTQNPGWAKPRPQSSFQFTQGTSPPWAPQSDFFPIHEQLSRLTPLTVTPSAETAGASAMSHNNASPKTPSAPCAPSTTPEPTTDAQTLPAPAAATISLFLIAVLPPWPTASTAVRTTLPFIETVVNDQSLPLAGLFPLRP